MTRYAFPRSFDLCVPSPPVEDAETQRMLRVIRELAPLQRDLVSDGYDAALAAIDAPLTVHEFPTGYEAFTWTVPEKWKAQLWMIVPAHPSLHIPLPGQVMSYSASFKGRVSKADLLAHLHTNPDRPQATPYSYSFYERNWGWSIPYDDYRDLPDGEYDVDILTELESGTLKVGEWVIRGETDESVVFCAHLDHPRQANDGLSGVAVGLALFDRLAQLDLRYTYRLVLCPENIGSACYLSKNEAPIKYAVILEMLGNKGHLNVQHSRQGDTDLDQLAMMAAEEIEPVVGEGDFRQVICNDEVNFNGPGINIPTVSLSRWPYPEYHTSDDTIGIISGPYLRRSLAVVGNLVKALEADRVLVPQYTGIPMLSRYGLYEDLNVDDTVERMALGFDGRATVSEIAEQVGIPFRRACEYAGAFQKAGLVTDA